MDTRILNDLQEGVLTHSPEETEALGERLASLLPDDTWLALYGDLGAGKTTFSRGFARGLGIQADVTSPTFSIFVPYQGKDRQLVHMDAYRLNGPEALDGLMLDDILRSPFVILLEWPERIAAALPPDTWHLKLETVDPTSRRLQLRPFPS